ncbi:MAG: cation transporter [Bacteroidales bacterium]
MKILKLFISALFLSVLSITASAQHNHSNMGSNSNMNMNMNQNTHMNMTPTKSATLKVWGKCEMCKGRIEKTAIARGATTADWNVKTKLLTVNFDPTKTDVGYLSNKLAKAGYDTENYKAKDKAYNALPDCCKYERVK